MNRRSLRHAVPPLLMALLAAGVIVTGQASALSLGALSASSHLGEPLRARLTLDGLPADHQGVTINVVGQDSVQGHAIAWTTHIERGADGRNYLLISSTEKIEDPALTLRIEVHTPDGTTSSKDQTLLLAPLGKSQNVSNTVVTGTITAAPPRGNGSSLATRMSTAIPTIIAGSADVPDQDPTIHPIAPIEAAPSPQKLSPSTPAPKVAPHLPQRKNPVQPPSPKPISPTTTPVAKDLAPAATAGSDDSVRALNAELLNTMVRQAELQAEQLRLIQRIQQANAAETAALARQTATLPPAPSSAIVAPASPAAPRSQPAPGMTTASSTTPSPAPATPPIPAASGERLGASSAIPTSPSTSPDAVSLPVSPIAVSNPTAPVTPNVAMPTSSLAAPSSPSSVTNAPEAASSPSTAVRPRPVHPASRPRMVHTPGVVHDETPSNDGILGLGLTPSTAAGGAAVVLLGGLLVLRRRRAKKDQQPLTEDDVSPDLQNPFPTGRRIEPEDEPSMEVIDFGSQLRMPDPSEPSGDPHNPQSH